MTNWHQLFGLFLIDFFTNSPYAVELEKDLSIKQQWLDVVVLRKMPGVLQRRLPDGLDGLEDHNLLTYKSMHEPLDDWALKELVGHYVNYRKQVGLSMNDLMPESQFKLYAVSTRFPAKLAQQVALQHISTGVYDIVWGTDTIRLIVLSQIPDGEHNALWRLFSAQSALVLQAFHQYKINQPEISTIVRDLLERYQQEKIDMSYTIQDYQKDYVRDHLNLLSPDDVLKRYSADDRLKDLSADEVLKRYSADDRLKDLSADEVLKHYSPDDILANLSPDVIKWLKQSIQQ